MDFNIVDKYITVELAAAILCWGLIAFAAFCLIYIFYLYFRSNKREKEIFQKVEDKIDEMNVMELQCYRDEVKEKNFRWLYISYDIADRVDYFMKKNHLLDEEMAELLESDIQYVQELKKGGKDLTLSEMSKLSKVMGYQYLRLLDI